MAWLSPDPGIVQLVEAHYTPLYRFAYRLCGSTADAEDLTQDTFCKAQLKWRQLKDDGKVRPWLFRILRNEYLQRVRGESRKKTIALDKAAELAIAEKNGRFDISSEELQEALNELPEPFRTPIILYFFEDFSYRNIAEQMDLPIGTVMSRLSRAKTFLRDRLEGEAGKPVLPPEINPS